MDREDQGPNTFESYAGLECHADLNRVLNEHRRSQGNTEPSEVYEFDDQYGSLSAAEANSILIVRNRAGEVVAYGRVHFDGMASGAEAALLWAASHVASPAIVYELIAHLETLATLERSDLCAFVVMGGARHEEFGVDLKTEKMKSAGYVEDRRIAMIRHRVRLGGHDEPNNPAIITCPADRHLDAWFAHFSATNGLKDREAADGAYEQFRRTPAWEPRHWKVLIESGHIVGQIRGHIRVGGDGVVRGFLDDMSVAETHRRRGLGRDLLLAGLKSLANAGAAYVESSVELAGPNVRLTRSVGFETVSVLPFFRKIVRGHARDA